MGRTVEKYSNKRNEEISSTSLNPAFIGGNWVGLLKNTLKTKHKEGITKSSITQSLLS
jgi:hypothetical protein